MGYKNRTELEINNSSSSSEALLFATMCIIGLPVDVHVKDGSVYSGIFYTASVEKDYGIVLKKARMTRRGKSNANVANGAVVETLVILSCDLVQVVAKGVQLPPHGVAGSFAGENLEAVAGTVSSSEGQISEAKKAYRNSGRYENGFLHADDVPTKAEVDNGGTGLPLNHVRNTIQVDRAIKDGINAAKIEEASCDTVNGRQAQDSPKQVLELHEENVDEVQGSSSNLDPAHAQVIPAEADDSKMILKQLNGVSHGPASVHEKQVNQCSERPTSSDTSSDVACSYDSTSSNPVIDVTSAASTEMVPPESSGSNKVSKEFKLNPEAKIFSPSFANPLSASTPAVPVVASTPYIPSNSPVVPVTAAQSEVGMNPYVPHSSVPAKFVPYGNLAVGNGGSAAQFSQPLAGHVGSWAQPVRYAGHFPVQAGPAYVHPNSQTVMVGRVGGQLLYVQPVSNDYVQGMAAISQVPARPALMTPHQVQFPKHQGTAAGQAVQLCVPFPLMAGGPQPFAVPTHTHIPVLQPPIPTNRPISVPGSNGLYSTKFP
ncbi:polyadenylate-binding protein-interacting protein 4-like isoform X2 [Mangifera indica]|uniref:polyadenylate-binding protein-interacting protein 4-like isoform X2 n=1 Tax=Mangifera indica TaxID=29780 RepID=UPI001CFAB661|nr:polyadenylate-binding protein-interacting protein 4-like isoform X2 [Mangifera indica]